MLNMDCPGLPTQEGCLRTSRELLRSVDWSARTIQVTSGRPGGTTAAESDDSDVLRARGHSGARHDVHSAVQLGPEHHDPGPVPNLGRGTDVQLAHTAAAGGGGDARTRITDVSRT